MRNIQLFNVAPSLPTELEFLETLSYNMWWCWNSDAVELFRRIDPRTWRESEHNPFVFFSRISQQRLEYLVDDDGFMTHYDQVRKRFHAEVADSADGSSTAPPAEPIAYFSLEFGIHESLRLYSGGLGCLAGDHLKSASDLGVPMVAVGLMYRCGYFQQYLSEDGWQQESCRENEIHRLPLHKACGTDGKPIQVTLPLPDGNLVAAVWRLDVGRIALFLLDANVVENSPAHQGITTHLYDSDRQTRLRQELLLGIGGFRALTALGLNPKVCHMNEGHAAFAGLARVSHVMADKGVDMNTATEIVRRTNVFTTHTPVPAGNETFDTDLLRRHLSALETETGIPADTAISWAQPPGGKGEQKESVMTILALRMSDFSNGVSKIHGHISRRMWKDLWPERPDDEIPIGHITNGIHATSWLSYDNAVILDRYLGPKWRDNPTSDKMLSRIVQIPDEELWRARDIGRSRLIGYARELAEKQMSVRNATRAEIDQIRSILNQDVLTVAFARRFATYKRATLLLKNPERLKALLTNKERPVQMIFAGKAHPADDKGKDLIRELVSFARQSADIRNRIVFLENYDIQIARYLVQGADIWLNTPRRPHEASGTSGMKAAMNGALHLSVPDGWWDEAYTPEVGWAIGRGEDYDNVDYQDSVESQALYNLLENEIVPRFYDRDGDIPSDWVEMMKASIRMALGSFSSHRMLSEYMDNLYSPAISTHDELVASECGKAVELVAQHRRLSDLWQRVTVKQPVADRDISTLHVGDQFEVTLHVELGELTADEVDVQVYHGRINGANEIVESHAETMQLVEVLDDEHCLYKQSIVCKKSGRYGLTARATPRGSDWKKLIPGFITWADGS